MKLLLDYRYEREIKRKKEMADYSKSPGVGDAYVNWRYASELFHECKRLLVEPELTVAGVTRVAIDVDLCLPRMFADLAAGADSEDIRAAFASLSEMEENEVRRHARNAQDAEEL